MGEFDPFLNLLQRGRKERFSKSNKRVNFGFKKCRRGNISFLVHLVGAARIFPEYELREEINGLDSTAFRLFP
jgi:hypothetical protein